MSLNLQVVLEEARKLPVDKRRELADLILKDLGSHAREEDEEVQAARAIVRETSGSMAGLDRATLIMLVEDEEYCGY